MTIRCAEDDLFSDEGQTLLEGTGEDGDGWRLSLTPHGYLRFESTGGAAFECESGLPVHAAVDAGKTFRLGLSLSNYAWCLRHRPYAVEGSADFRLHLLAGQGASGEMMRIGGTSEVPSPDLAPAPDRLHVGASADGSGRFAGRVTRRRPAPSSIISRALRSPAPKRSTPIPACTAHAANCPSPASTLSGSE